MTDISSLKAMLDWKLLEGSHDFPGSDGGTCINEAAVVAAGMKYRQVSGYKDFPECFSRELGELLLHVNDDLEDKDRQDLIRFIPLLAGSRASEAIEAERCKFIVRQWHGMQGLVIYNFDSIEERITTLKEAWDEVEDVTIDELLDVVLEAFAIGRTQEPINLEEASQRLTAARTEAALADENEEMEAPKMPTSTEPVLPAWRQALRVLMKA